MAVNKEHLLKIKAHILEEPKRLWMNEWIIKGEPGTRWHGKTEHEFPACGTIGCIAGWSHVLRGGEGVLSPLRESIFLGLDGEHLFYTWHWPWDLEIKYDRATTKEEQAEIVAMAIDRVIENNGRL